MRALIFTAIIQFFCFVLPANAEEDIATKVLNASSLEELRGAPEHSATIDQLDFIWSIPAKLVSEIVLNPSNNKAWEALHKFSHFTDGGLSSMYDDACFDAIKKTPLIYYSRYVYSGDDEVLDRVNDAMHAYLINDGNNIHSLEAGNRKYIETMITLIKQQKSSDANLSKRHIDFLSLTELKYNLRKKEFNEYFGDK